jgi:hypothetical protein
MVMGSPAAAVALATLGLPLRLGRSVPASLVLALATPLIAALIVGLIVMASLLACELTHDSAYLVGQ